MRKTNIDGIQKIKHASIKKRIHYVRVVSTPAAPRIARGFVWSNFSFLKRRNTALAAATFGLLLAFGSGMWVEFSTKNTLADQNPPYTAPPGVVANLGTLPTSSLASIPSDQFYNLTLDQVEGYLKDALKTPEAKQAELLAQRKVKLKAYLQQKGSPFAEISDTIAELKHWQMVLAISNSESSLGKRCYTNNCSGIGVEPGHPLWREYETKAEWAKDLDRLIEKRYKDWTLEQMNGVYNKPGSANWLSASKQILEELQQNNIE